MPGEAPWLSSISILGQLVHAVNESGQARVPITVAAHGTLVSGVLIAHKAYFVSWPKAARCSALSQMDRAGQGRAGRGPGG
jgi:hypothetical protein